MYMHFLKKSGYHRTTHKNLSEIVSIQMICPSQFFKMGIDSPVPWHSILVSNVMIARSHFHDLGPTVWQTLSMESTLLLAFLTWFLRSDPRPLSCSMCLCHCLDDLSFTFTFIQLELNPPFLLIGLLSEQHCLPVWMAGLANSQTHYNNFQ